VRTLNIPKLKYYMNLKGYTQKSIAPPIGVSQTTVNSYFGNKISPRMDTIKKFCELLEIPREDVLSIFFDVNVPSHATCSEPKKVS
jgi:DNA-binding XRE family transcriptional regulator